MRIGPNDQIWIVTNPTIDTRKLSEIVQVSSINDLAALFRGGLGPEADVAIHTKEREALMDGEARMQGKRLTVRQKWSMAQRV